MRSPNDQETSGQYLFDAGQSWLKENDPTAPLARWGRITPNEQRFWDAMGLTVHEWIVRQGLCGFLNGCFYGLAFGFLSAAFFFYFTGHW